MSLADLAKIVAEKKAEIAAALKDAGEREVKAAVKKLFDEHPTLQAVRWTQYTPYFNDGDPCVFGVNDVEFLLVGEDAEEEEWHYTWDSRLKKDNIGKSVGELSKQLQALDDGMEMVFGDGVQITCTREKIEVEEYEHD